MDLPFFSTQVGTWKKIQNNWFQISDNRQTGLCLMREENQIRWALWLTQLSACRCSVHPEKAQREGTQVEYQVVKWTEATVIRVCGNGGSWQWWDTISEERKLLRQSSRTVHGGKCCLLSFQMKTICVGWNSGRTKNDQGA